MSNQPQYSALYRVIEGKIVPTSKELGISQVVFSAGAGADRKIQGWSAGSGRVSGY